MTQLPESFIGQNLEQSENLSYGSNIYVSQKIKNFNPSTNSLTASRKSTGIRSHYTEISDPMLKEYQENQIEFEEKEKNEKEYRKKKDIIIFIVLLFFVATFTVLVYKIVGLIFPKDNSQPPPKPNNYFSL
ncbi:hypothetical protein PPERSA_06411 [Pseudocohnilembus persalinus]|uniref:Transmembrane protein n=1 Tax=Pseudocohnilembus persalinus TaxID=266149 RepID=A0A0V0QR84_PSEPJ|nr:hypothetical protein PPERSA_06411 [Pseudocohnilembus persalinus]|eukprot:KRX04777.1 hypothetical protein PPERSA_06411 [Pseudocohnilembus persalinus]